MAGMPQRKVKAKYRTVGPKTERVVRTMAVMDENKSMQQKRVAKEEEVFYVYFPQGHSIRINRAELIRMGYHLKPKLIDMETGDVVDIGGDPYDFVSDADLIGPNGEELEIVLEGDNEDEIDEELGSSKRQAKG